MNYMTRLAAMAREVAGDRVGVEVDRDTLHFTYGNARTRGTVPLDVDKRARPTLETLSRVIDRATTHLVFDIPKYKPAFVPDAKALLAILKGDD